MLRYVMLSLVVVATAALAAPAAAPPPPPLTARQREELAARWDKAIKSAKALRQGDKIAEAAKAYREALALARRLLPGARQPSGDLDLDESLGGLADLYHDFGLIAEAEPLYRESLAVRRRLFKGDHLAIALLQSRLSGVCSQQGKFADAETFSKDALEAYKRLHAGKDHADVAFGLNDLAILYWTQGRPADAAPLLKSALDVTVRLHKGGDHEEVAGRQYALANLYWTQGKLADSELLFKDSLEMRKRLHKGDHARIAWGLAGLAILCRQQGKFSDLDAHSKEALAAFRRLSKSADDPNVATGLTLRGFAHQDQNRLAEAESAYKEVLEIRERLSPKADHADLAEARNNLARVYQQQGKLADAARLFLSALQMRKRLHKGDHPALALAQNNLALLYLDQGKIADAEPLMKEALGMFRRLHKGDHSEVMTASLNLVLVYLAGGKRADAVEPCDASLGMLNRLARHHARQKSEGEALTFAASQPPARDARLSLARALSGDKTFDPAAAYQAVWESKGTLGRAYEQRQARGRAADEAAAKQLDALAVARRRRADLLLAVPTRDPVTLQRREADLSALDANIARGNATLPKLLPALTRLDKLDKATVADLQKALPADVALVDYVRYADYEWDNKKPAGQQQTWVMRYAAFVVTRDKVTWIDLDSEAAIKPAVSKWREAIVADKGVPAKLGAEVRKLVWEPVRKALPKGVTTIYVCPDADLCGLPFAALPGDKANTVLLEDFALAAVPHAPFLLDHLWPQDKPKNPPSGALVVGGVTYDADVGTDARTKTGPLLKPDQKLSWRFLKGSATEADAVARSARRNKLAVSRLAGDKATAAAVLDALPRAKVAHFATHGFFADVSFRGLFQLDEKDYQRSLRGERIGRAVNSPLVMTGLVFAGANQPTTPGRGILTGEALIDRDLSGLELAVLSACETGLGDLGGGGEGVFGLQRAFHYAGTRNVVASLWKVDDLATAALMSEFYFQLWEKNRPPIEALRQAQLAVYRADAKRFAEMAARGLGVGTKDVTNLPVLAADAKKGAGNRPALWAAFVLSGVGK